MKAMILAAGLGTRLRPLTDTTPKPLIDIGGVTMLEVILRRLAAAGATEVIINTHHLSGKIAAFLAGKKNFGLKIELSRETFFPLETGGGLKKAAWFFGDGKPFFLYNSDVFTDMDLGAMYKAHLGTGALATLAVKDRPTSRQLIFDADLNLRGRFNAAESRFEWAAGPVDNPSRLAFSGVHVISPEIFDIMTEAGIFSITDVYLRLAGAGAKIKGFRMDDFYWQDIGSLERLEALKRHVARNGLKI
jgi:NDP-sugar pyrophosphorylase family protein